LPLKLIPKLQKYKKHVESRARVCIKTDF
jgi:hypothetical protein